MNRLAVALSLPIGAALLLQANPSQAVTTVTVGVTTYDIDFFSGTLSEFLNEPFAPPIASFPWFGDSSLAQDFADAAFQEVGSSLDQTLDDASALSGQITLGPLFYYDTGFFAAYDPASSAANTFTCDPADFVQCDAPSITWAYYVESAPPVPAPVPAPLPLLGATAAFSFSRKLRRRVNAQKFTF
jgi:hypothetical protein